MDADIVARIKDVAIYLRKSRGNEEEDLEKHREDLIELCLQNNWRYTEYAEIGSSQVIEDRPKLSELLKDIVDGLYDAVLVVDKDRLSRQGLGQAQINELFAENDCLIVTPQKIYDLSNDSDILMTEFEDMMSRFEYRMINKRFRRGKKRSAKQGKWSNGTPPLPYMYDSDYQNNPDNPQGHSLIIDEEKLDIYRFIVEEFIVGSSPYNIAWELNKMKVPSPRGGLWKDITVRRLLLDETHLGRIISNKTHGWKKDRKTKKHSYIANRKEDWIIVENCHKPVKSIEEHEKILIEINKRKRKTYAKGGTFSLTGIVKCSKCGKSMSFQRKDNDYPMIKICQYFLDDGVTKCGNKGGSTKILIEEIERQLYKFKEDIEKQIKQEKSENNLSVTIQRETTKKQNKINELEEELEQVTALALAKFFTPDEAVKQKTKILDEVKRLEDEIHSLNLQNNNIENMTNQERVTSIESLLESLQDKTLPIYKINRAYKSIIHSIVWDKPDSDNLTVNINFL